MLDWLSCNNEHKWYCSLKASILIRERSFYIYSGFILSYNVGITKTVVTKVKAYEPQPADTTVEEIMIWKSVIDLVLSGSTRKKKMRWWTEILSECIILNDNSYLLPVLLLSHARQNSISSSIIKSISTGLVQN